jgi:hypothetical protein
MTSDSAYEQDQSRWGQVTGSGKDRMYITKLGDTLESVAAFFYGDPVQRQRIIDDNPEWARYQAGASFPTGSRIRVPEDAARGDTVPES